MTNSILMADAENMDVIWTPVSGYPGYLVSNMGKIVATRKWVIRGRGKGSHVATEKLLVPRDNGKGYLKVRLTGMDGKQHEVQVSRIVAREFCSRPEGADCVAHINKDPRDNRAENLIWTTRSALKRLLQANLSTCC